MIEIVEGECYVGLLKIIDEYVLVLMAYGLYVFRGTNSKSVSKL